MPGCEINGDLKRGMRDCMGLACGDKLVDFTRGAGIDSFLGIKVYKGDRFHRESCSCRNTL